MITHSPTPIDMDYGQTQSNTTKNQRQPPVLKDQDESERMRPQGIKKRHAIRKSLRLRAIRQSYKKPSFKSNHTQEVQTPPSPPASNIPNIPHPQILAPTPQPSRNLKRAQEEQEFEVSPPTSDQPSPKRPRVESSSCTAEERLRPKTASNISEDDLDPIQYWIETGRWHKKYFKQDSQVREDFERGKSPIEFEQGEYILGHYNREPLRPMHAFHHLHYLLAKKKSSSSLRRKNSQSTIQTPSDQLPREIKSAQYRNPEYETRMEDKGSYMRKSTLGITDRSMVLCRALLEEEQTIPQDTLFRDDLFDETCESIQGRNEAVVIRNISLLICPSAQILRIFGAKHLNHLYESVNEGWNNAEPFEGTRPQPDYSVGFGRSAFNQEQREKLRPFVGELGSRVLTYFMATTRLYFPFLTCEVKCGAAALDVADRQNAHSMTIAVRALIELFRYTGREKELQGEILAFSISHDHRSVRIYGHYAIIEENKTLYYRHPITTFDFTNREGIDKWTAYKFTKNVYDNWVPIQHARICSAIDALPSDIDFDLSQSASFTESSIAGSQGATTTTSFTPTQTTGRASKKARSEPLRTS